MAASSWVHLGSWPGISLADSLIWQGPEITSLFRTEFDIWKGYLNVFTDGGTTQHMFAPTAFFDEVAAGFIGDECVDLKFDDPVRKDLDPARQGIPRS